MDNTNPSPSTVNTDPSPPTQNNIPSSSLPNTHPMVTRSKNNIYKPKSVHHVTKHPLPEVLEPTTVGQALAHPEWRSAMSDEFNALIKNGTWILVPPDSQQNLVSCKWIFRVKRNADGSVQKYKAHWL